MGSIKLCYHYYTLVKIAIFWMLLHTHRCRKLLDDNWKYT